MLGNNLIRHITEFLKISKQKSGVGGQDTQATVSSPPPSIPDIQWNM